MKNRDSVLDKGTNPKGETETLSVWQGLTITYADSLERYTYKEQFQKTSWRLLDICNKYFQCYEFIPEFTENGRIHYHGRYKSKSKKASLLAYQELRKTGFIKIEKIKDHNAWNTYIYKEYNDTSKLIDSCYCILITKAEYERRQLQMSKKRMLFEEVSNQLIQ